MPVLVDTNKILDNVISYKLKESFDHLVKISGRDKYRMPEAHYADDAYLTDNEYDILHEHLNTNDKLISGETDKSSSEWFGFYGGELKIPKVWYNISPSKQKAIPAAFNFDKCGEFFVMRFQNNPEKLTLLINDAKKNGYEIEQLDLTTLTVAMKIIPHPKGF